MEDSRSINSGGEGGSGAGAGPEGDSTGHIGRVTFWDHLPYPGHIFNNVLNIDYIQKEKVVKNP